MGHADFLQSAREFEQGRDRIVFTTEADLLWRTREARLFDLNVPRSVCFHFEYVLTGTSSAECAGNAYGAPLDSEGLQLPTLIINQINPEAGLTLMGHSWVILNTVSPDSSWKNSDADVWLPESVMGLACPGGGSGTAFSCGSDTAWSCASCCCSTGFC